MKDVSGDPFIVDLDGIYTLLNHHKERVWTYNTYDMIAARVVVTSVLYQENHNYSRVFWIFVTMSFL